MFENIIKFFKNLGKSNKEAGNSKEAAKERLHLVLMQDRANVSADFLELMKQEIIEVIKKYIDVDESAIDVRLANKTNEDGTTGAPALYANIPIKTIKDEARKVQKQSGNNLNATENNDNKTNSNNETKTDNVQTENINEGKHAQINNKENDRENNEVNDKVNNEVNNENTNSNTNNENEKMENTPLSKNA